MSKLLAIATTLSLLLNPVRGQAQDETWLHVHVTDNGVTQLQLNLPASMLDTMLESFGGSFLTALHSDGDPSFDIRELWLATRDAGDVEILNAREGEARVRVSRAGDRILVEAEDGDETARIELPVAIADALFSGDASGSDMQLAIEEFVRQGGSDLVVVQDGSETVRLWVDNRADQN